MAINYIQFSAASATDGVTVAADTMDVGTATGVEVQLIKFGYGTDEVYNQVATSTPLPVNVATGIVLDVSGATTATQPVTITNTATVSLATDNIIDVSAATTATQPVIITNTATVVVSGVITASQSTHDSLNANANLQIGNADATATHPVPIYVLTATGGTATVPVSVATAATFAVEVQNTATVVVSGVITALQSTHDDLNANANLQVANTDVAVGNPVWVQISTSGTATIPVSVATGVVFDVSAATTATQPVTITNTATVAITGNVNTTITATGLDPLTNDIATGINTTTTLISGGSFTSTAEDVSEYSAVTTEIVTDRPSTSDGMKFEFSSDGTNFDDSYSFTFSTGTATSGARRFQFPVTAQYYRINYETTSTATQGVFRVQTIKHRRDVSTSVHRLGDDVSADRSTGLTKSAIIAQVSGAGDFVPIQANAAGNLKIGGAVEVETWSATEPVNVATDLTYPVSLATEVILATGNVIDVSAATTATNAVAITTFTATGVGLIRPIVPRGNQKAVLFTTTATTVATLATSITNTFQDLIAVHVVNSGTGPVGISLRDTSTATSWDHELAADGGGFAMNFWPPKEQSAAAGSWLMALDAQPTAKVSVMMQLMKVT